MSTAPTRDQLPRRQRHHRHRHRRQHHHLRQRNNNQHVYQCQYTTNECQHLHEDFHDDVETKRRVTIDDGESTETRPKVNPIFLWALQREQRIIEVRCEDYDKRNRIKLTKTPHGWRSIPRTASNVYNHCCCTARTNLFPKDSTTKATSSSLSSSSSSPSVSSSCVPCSLSLKSASSSPCSSTESGLFSSMKGIKQRVNKEKKRRIHVSDDESDTTRTSSCRTSGRSYDMSGEDDTQDDEPDDVDNVNDVVRDDEFDEYTFVDGDELNTRFLTCGRRTFRLIDLEKAQNNQLLQPRVVLEPLNPSRLRLNSISERAKVDDDIEMIVEDDDEVVEEVDEEEMDMSSKLHDNNNDTSVVNHDIKELVVDNCTKNEDTDEEIEEIDDKDDIDELDDDNPTVFEYEDRDSIEMMDEQEIQERDSVILESNDIVQVAKDTEKLNNAVNIIEIERKSTDSTPTTNKRMRQQSATSILQVPDLKPINMPTNNSTIITRKICADERLLPSPPCSVTCSEDASKPEIPRVPLNPLNRRKREAPDLIEVKPTEWRRRESIRPAQQLRELIKQSGLLIPDPLLVPRNILPILAANPATEIPELLANRPELRLPEALSRPELLADPDLLVISLGHLQKVLDAIPETRSRVEVRGRIERPAENTQASSVTAASASAAAAAAAAAVASDGKRLACKPIGSLMPAPMDLSKRSPVVTRVAQDSISRMKIGLSKQESEVTSTARLPGDDSRLWHPLFGCRQKPREQLPRGKLSNPQSTERHHQHSQNYQQQPQDTGQQHRASWHRTTLAS